MVDQQFISGWSMVKYSNRGFIIFDNIHNWLVDGCLPMINWWIHNRYSMNVRIISNHSLHGWFININHTLTQGPHFEPNTGRCQAAPFLPPWRVEGTAAFLAASKRPYPSQCPGRIVSRLKMRDLNNKKTWLLVGGFNPSEQQKTMVNIGWY